MGKKKRKCQPCTACCDGWLQMVINDTPVYPGCPCPHSTSRGCNDYENRPVSCVEFNCGWIVPDSPLPDWLKPDNGKVIVVFNKLVWQGIPVDLAVPIGKRIPGRSLNWIKSFSERQGRPLVYMQQFDDSKKLQKEQEVIGYGPPEFQHYLAMLQHDGKSLW